MGEVIGIISGKGGVGKTCTALNLGAALAGFGKEVIVVDANITTPNIGLYLGIHSKKDSKAYLHEVLKGKFKPEDALYKHNSGIKLLLCSLSLKSIKSIKLEKIKDILKKLSSIADFVLVDGAAGLGREALSTIQNSDTLLVVTNPEMPALVDALRTIKVAELLGKDVQGILVNRAEKRNKKNKALEIQNIEKLLEKPVLSLIPEDRAMKEALSKKECVTLIKQNSPAALEYKRLAASMIGKEYNPNIQNKLSLINILRKIFIRQ